MPWTTPETFTAGQTLTAASMNAMTENDRVLRSYANRFATSRRTAGDLTLGGSTSWGDVGGPADLTLTASSGDLIEVAVSFLIDGGGQILFMDAVTIVSGSPVNSFGHGVTPSNSYNGIDAWRCPASVSAGVGGSFFYILQAGDISGGNVTIRLRYRMNGTTPSRVISANTNDPFVFFARNLGPVTTA